MKKKQIKKVLKNAALLILIFFIGFMGSMILLLNQSSNMTNFIINANAQTTKYINILGFNVMAFISVLNDDGSFSIEIIKSNYYDFIPIIVGLILVFLSILITLCTKFFLRNKNKEKR